MTDDSKLYELNKEEIACMNFVSGFIQGKCWDSDIGFFDRFLKLVARVSRESEGGTKID